MGNFTTTLMTSGESLTETVVEHGATIIATGGKEYTPSEYLYGKNPNVLTHFDLDAALESDDPRLSAARSVAFIQCVGSRTPERPYCSRLCCTHTVKSALSLKERNPEMDIYVLYRISAPTGSAKNCIKRLGKRASSSCVTTWKTTCPT